MDCRSNFPGRPMAGRPISSSCSPGPSPRNRIELGASPSPRTTFFLPSARGHFWQFWILSCRSRSFSRGVLSSVTLLLLGPPTVRFHWTRLEWSDVGVDVGCGLRLHKHHAVAQPAVGVAIEGVGESGYFEECPELILSEDRNAPNLNFGFRRPFIDERVFHETSMFDIRGILLTRQEN